MKRTAIRLLLALGIIFTFTTCSKDHLFDCLTSTGNTIYQWRNAGKFTNLNLQNDVDVVLYFDTTNFIRVTAGEHLIDGIITELSGNTLYIRNENRCNWVRSFKNQYVVEIGMDSITKIDTYGAGNITCHDTITCHDFYFDAWNATGTANFLFHNQYIHLNNNVGRVDIHAAGRTDVAFGNIADVGTLDAKNLSCDLWYFRTNSTGDSHLTANNTLEAEIQYTGNVYYSGAATNVRRTGSGSGMLIRE